MKSKTIHYVLFLFLLICMSACSSSKVGCYDFSIELKTELESHDSLEAITKDENYCE